MIAALTMAGCKCNSKKSQEPTQEEIQGTKQALADTVLAKIDELAEQYCNARSNMFKFRTIALTDAEKVIKPDYLLDPSVAGTLVTRDQKIRALAFYTVDIGLSKAYGLPVEELKEVALKLAAELNVPFDLELSTSNAPTSEKIKARYNACKENGCLGDFWMFENALRIEMYYIVANNQELFFSKITDDQWQSFGIVGKTVREAIAELAKYDEEMASLMKLNETIRISVSDEERDKVSQSKAYAKQFYFANKDKIIAKRNALLK